MRAGHVCAAARRRPAAAPIAALASPSLPAASGGCRSIWTRGAALPPAVPAVSRASTQLAARPHIAPLPRRGTRGFLASLVAKPEPVLHKERRLLAFPPSHVYNVVARVDEYRHFIPWCIDSSVENVQGNVYDATLAVGFQLFSERYLSKITVEPGTKVLSIAQNTQLFHHLINEWSFAPGPTRELRVTPAAARAAGLPPGTPLPASVTVETCWLTMSVDFQFRSGLYAHAANMFLDEVVSKMVGAFEARCADTWRRGGEAAYVASALAAAAAAGQLPAPPAEAVPVAAAVVGPSAAPLTAAAPQPSAPAPLQPHAAAADAATALGHGPAVSHATGERLKAPATAAAKLPPLPAAVSAHSSSASASGSSTAAARAFMGAPESKAGAASAPRTPQHQPRPHSAAHASAPRVYSTPTPTVAASSNAAGVGAKRASAAAPGSKAPAWPILPSAKLLPSPRSWSPAQAAAADAAKRAAQEQQQPGAAAGTAEPPFISPTVW